MIERTACNTVCEHGGICDLDVGHAGNHNAGGYCEWEPAPGEVVESDAEMVVNTISMMLGRVELDLL